MQLMIFQSILSVFLHNNYAATDYDDTFKLVLYVYINIKTHSSVSCSPRSWRATP